MTSSIACGVHSRALIQCTFTTPRAVISCNSMADTEVLANQPVVIDNVSFLFVCMSSQETLTLKSIQGSGILKAGFAGEDAPKLVFPA